MVGEIIKEKYKIESVFSESHMYEIFTAIEAETGQRVVLKLMKEEMAVSPERVRCFSEEIKNFASLSHPNIAEILDLDMYENRPYVVSPLIAGKELNLVMKDEVLSLPDSVKIIQDLASVLKCASEYKIENRNINLSNVLRSKEGNVTVLSFTLPRLKLVSSVPIKRSENAGIQADLYFLGTALFELLAGESPIRKIGGLNELWDMKLEKSLRIRHSELEPALQGKLIAFIGKTLTRDINNRFNSYEDFLKSLADLAGNLRKASIKNRASRQMSMASHVVDVLNGKINDTSVISVPGTLTSAANESLKVSASLRDNVNACDTTIKTGFAESNIEGNLALAVEGDEIREDRVRAFSKPKLKLVKSKQEEWKEEQSLLKSPVTLIGFVMAIMIFLILFW